MFFRDQYLQPYRGEHPYVFLSYSHKDEKDAASFIQTLKQMGFRVWYDEGLEPGSEWPPEIAQRILNCGYFIALVSSNYLSSKMCRRELNFADSENKPLLLVYLDAAEQPPEMRMQYGALQALFKHRDGSRIYEKINVIPEIQICRASNTGPNPYPYPNPNRPKWLIPVIIAGAVTLIGLALALVFLRPGFVLPSPTGPSTEPPALVSDSGVPTDTAGEAEAPDPENRPYLRYEPIHPDDWKMETYEKALKEAAAFDLKDKQSGKPILRSQVKQIIFLSCSDAPKDALKDAQDVSLAADGSVLAWYETNKDGQYSISIAAQGGVRMPADLSGLFAGYSILEEINWDKDTVSFEGVTNMQALFAFCPKLGTAEKPLDLSVMDTSAVTDMGCMFHSCTGMQELNLSGFNTAAVNNMLGMFTFCRALQTLTFGDGFQTGIVTDMHSMFYGCSSLTELNLRSFDTSMVANMYAMFRGCTKLEAIRFGDRFIMSESTDLKASSLFRDCSALKSLTFPSPIYLNENMFYGCASLKALALRGGVLDPDKASDAAFYGCDMKVYYPQAQKDALSALLRKQLGGKIQWLPTCVIVGTDGLDGTLCENVFGQDSTVWNVIADADRSAYVEWERSEPDGLPFYGTWLKWQNTAEGYAGPRKWVLYGRNSESEGWIELSKGDYSGSRGESSTLVLPGLTDSGNWKPYEEFSSYKYYKFVLLGPEDGSAEEEIRLCRIRLLTKEDYLDYQRDGKWPGDKNAP